MTGTVSGDHATALWQTGLERMTRRIDWTGRQELAGFPHFADTDTGVWTTSPGGDWTGSFWTGQLWLAARSRPEPYLGWGRRWADRLRPRASSPTIFRSFLFYYGAVLGDLLFDDEQATAIAVDGARGLAADFNDTAGVVPLGTAAEEATDIGDGETSIDAVGAVSGLFAWATQRTGDPTYREVGLRHAERHAEWLVRSDGSVVQSAGFDAASGDLLRTYTHKGYSDESTWARAQAWGLLAFTLSAQWLGPNRAFVDLAARIADWWIAHAPADLVAFYDFDDPAIPHVERDTSSTAIVAASLLKLSALVPDNEQATRYLAVAEATVDALVGGYLTPTSPHDRRPVGILTDGCYNKRIGLATNSELVWGDYFLFEALSVLAGRIPPDLV